MPGGGNASGGSVLVSGGTDPESSWQYPSLGCGLISMLLGVLSGGTSVKKGLIFFAIVVWVWDLLL